MNNFKRINTAKDMLKFDTHIEKDYDDLGVYINGYYLNDISPAVHPELYDDINSLHSSNITDENIIDALTNLRHLSASLNLDFNDLLRMSELHYEAEKKEK